MAQPQTQFWRINYCSVYDEDDALAGAEIMWKMLGASGYPIGVNNIYVEERESFHVYALIRLDALGVTEAELHRHFGYMAAHSMDDDYSFECSMWTYHLLTKDEYVLIRTRHAHDQW